MWNDLKVHLRALVILARREEGQGLVEYGLILGLVSVALIAALGALTGALTAIFAAVQAALEGA